MTRSITVLGSTGSIGVQTLDVARMHHIKVVALTANQRIDILEKQAREFQPALVAVRDAQAAAQLKIALADTEITGKEKMKALELLGKHLGMFNGGGS